MMIVKSISREREREKETEKFKSDIADVEISDLEGQRMSVAIVDLTR